MNWIRRPLVLTLGGLLAWALLPWTAFHTRLDLVVKGQTITMKADDTTLSVHLPVETVTGLEIHAADSFYHVSFRSLVLTDGRGAARSIPVPPSTQIPPGTFVPVADWTVDDRANPARIVDVPVRLEPPFRMQAVVTGRFSRFLVFRFRGKPGFEVRIRNGLINYDASLVGSDGHVLRVSSLETPPTRLATAIAGALLRAYLMGLVLLAGFRGIALLARKLPDLSARHENRVRAVVARAGWPAALAAAAGVLLLETWLSRDILEALPHSQDALAYLLQARWLVAGKLFAAAPPIHEHLRVPFTYFAEGKWFTHLSVMWPLVLAVGEAMGRASLVNPVLGALYVLVLYGVARRQGGSAAGLVAVLLATLSPLRALLQGSFLSHGLAGLAALVFVGALTRGLHRGSPAWCGAAGAALGLVFSARPLTALALVPPTILYGAFRLRRLPHTLTLLRCARLFLLGGVAGTLPILVFNAFLTGDPFTFGYMLFERGGNPVGLSYLPIGLRKLDVQLAYLWPNILGFGWPSITGWLAAAFPLGLASIPFLSGRARAEDWWHLGLLAAVPGAYTLTKYWGVHGFGARYYFEVLFAFFTLGARGILVLARPRRGHRLLTGLLVLAALTVAATHAAQHLKQRLSLYTGYNGVDGVMRQRLAASGIHRGVLLIRAPSWHHWGNAADQVRGDLREPLVVAEELPDNQALIDFYRDRSFYRWTRRGLRPVSTTELGHPQDRSRTPGAGHGEIHRTPASVRSYAFVLGSLWIALAVIEGLCRPKDHRVATAVDRYHRTRRRRGSSPARRRGGRLFLAMAVAGGLLLWGYGLARNSATAPGAGPDHGLGGVHPGGAPPGLTRITDLALDPSDPRRLFAASTRGLFLSTDGGATFQFVDTGDGPVNMTAIGFAPTDPTRLYLAAQDGRGFYVSKDRGLSWRWCGGGRGPRNTMTLAPHPKAPEIVLAGTNGRGMFRTTDGGRTWEICRGLDRGVVRAVAFDPARPEKVLAGTEGQGLYRSDDGGRSWRPLPAPGSGKTRAIIALPEPPGSWLHGTFATGVFRSEDDGVSWSPLARPWGAVEVRAFETLPGSGRLAAATLGRGVLVSSDGGRSFRPLHPELAAYHTVDLEAGPRGRRLFVATEEDVLLTSHDGGRTWRARHWRTVSGPR